MRGHVGVVDGDVFVVQIVVLVWLLAWTARAIVRISSGDTRTVLVVPRIGKARATKWSALTGSLLALLICLFMVPPLGLQGMATHLLLGLGLAAFMAAFEVQHGSNHLVRSAKTSPVANPPPPAP